MTAEALVADLDRLHESLQARPVALLGHSWGAGLAALYAMAHADRVTRLLLMGPLPPRAVPYLRKFNTTLHQRLTDEENSALAAAAAARRTASDEDVRSACRAYWRIFIRSYYADAETAARAKGDLCTAPQAAIRNGDRVNAAVWASLGEYDWREALTKVTVPTLTEGRREGDRRYERTASPHH